MAWKGKIMFVRALIAFLVMPFMVAFVLPVLGLAYSDHLHLVHPLGLAILLSGTAALLKCVRDFYVTGKGTLAPWSPPQHLVSVGLYCYSRNPMYIAVTLILLGWAVAFASGGLLLYMVVIAVSFHLRVVYGEEPWLERTYGGEWESYAGRVRRWF